MLKKVYIVGLVLLVLVSSVVIFQQVAMRQEKPDAGVLGVFGTNGQLKEPVKTTENNTVVNLSSSTPLSESTNKPSIEIKLEGSGCTSNVFPNDCKVINSQKPVVYLKNCTEQSWDKCNFYVYSLGKRDTDTQFIFQKYEENGDTLVDVLSYDMQTTVVGLVKTVLYQKNGENTAQIKLSNEDYTSTLAQYQRK